FRSQHFPVCSISTAFAIFTNCSFVFQSHWGFKSFNKHVLFCGSNSVPVLQSNSVPVFSDMVSKKFFLHILYKDSNLILFIVVLTVMALVVSGLNFWTENVPCFIQTSAVNKTIYK